MGLGRASLTMVLTGCAVGAGDNPDAHVFHNPDPIDARPAADSRVFDVPPGVVVPTVTNVAVASTNPDNGTTPYNTGTTTLIITGTGFTTVGCPAGVALDDPAATTPTGCGVDNDRQITAVFPAGIPTNGALGWNVKVTNPAGTNATSAVPFVPRAGLLVGEVYTGTSGSTDHEFVSVYNPTTKAIDPSDAGLGLHLHIINSVGTDTDKPLMPVTTTAVPSHGFLLLSSSQSMASDAWFTHIDYTYDASMGSTLVANGGVYLSLSVTNGTMVLDKVGWGSQPAGGYEATATANFTSGKSIQRLPSHPNGHATDTDNNAADFLTASSTIEGFGTGDPPAP
jgi:hypothetical protein